MYWLGVFLYNEKDKDFEMSEIDKKFKVISYSATRFYSREDLLVEGVDPDKYGLYSGQRRHSLRG